MGKKNYSLNRPREVQRPIPLPIFKRDYAISKKEEQKQKVVLDEKQKTVKLGDGRSCSVSAFLTG